MAYGKCQLAAGHAARAADAFRQGGSEAAELDPAWRLNLLRAFIAMGSREEASALIAELTASPLPGVRERVRAILGEFLPRLELDKGARAAFLTAYLAGAEPQPEDYDLLWALAQLTVEGGGAPGLRPLPLWLWRGPKDEASARQWRDAPRGLAARGVFATPEDQLARARQLRRLRLHAMIREEFDPDRLSDLPAEPARSIGRIWFWALGRTRAFSQALEALEREETRRRFALEARDALALAVEFHLRAGQLERALEKLGQLEQLAPGAFVLPGFYLDLARRTRGRGDLDELKRWCLQVIQRFPGHPRAPEAYWLLVWEHYRRGAPEEAVRWAQAFLVGPEAAAGPERFLYWLGRAQAQLGRESEAAEAWGALISRSPTDFYSLLAQGEALDQLALSPPPPRAASAPVDASPELGELWRQPSLRRAFMLALLDEQALAEASLEQALAQPAPEPALRELARALTRLRMYHLAQKVSHYLRPAPGAENGPDLEALRLIYPLAYWDRIAGQGRERLSPYFVLAVIREESHFRVDADSRAGAKGLMQLMPSTAAALARDHGLPDEEQALLEPGTNIALGTLYLERLAQRFDGNPLHIAAGYNAGPATVGRWLRTMGGLPPDEFIEAIPYEETQNYVKKVLATSILYRRLYPPR
jgi:soluble lytic murein transglycosylase